MKLVIRGKSYLVDISSGGEGEILGCFMQRGMVSGLCSCLLIKSIFARFMTMREKQILERAIEIQKENWG